MYFSDERDKFSGKDSFESYRKVSLVEKERKKESPVCMPSAGRRARIKPICFSEDWKRTSNSLERNSIKRNITVDTHQASY